MLRRLAKIHSESDLLIKKATPHIKFHFQFSSVQEGFLWVLFYFFDHYIQSSGGVIIIFKVQEGVIIIIKVQEGWYFNWFEPEVFVGPTIANN